MELGNLRILYIYGNIDQYRPFTSGIRNMKGFFKYSRDIVRVLHQIAVLYERLHRPRNIRLLENIAAYQFAVHLSGNTD